MASKPAELRRIQMSVSMSQEMFNTIRDVAHKRGIANGVLVEKAVGEWLQRNYPDRAAEAAK